MSIVISVINYKGGVGKTTLALNIAYGLSSILGKKVLMMDLDPQCSLSISALKELEWINHIENKGSIIDLIQQFYKGKWEFSDTWICQLKQSPNTYLLPGHLNLPEYEMKLVANKPLHLSTEEFENQRFLILNHFIKNIHNKFDIIILDCPPNIYMLSRNAILASNYYIIPTIPDFVSSFGIPFIYHHIEDFVQSWYGNTKFLGIILNKIRQQKQILIKEHRLEYEKLKEQFPNKVFNNFISDRILISSIMRRKINIFNETSKKYEIVQKEFTNLIKELDQKIKEQF
ncbi:MAG: cobyrinic acid a,c-diamide synthase [Leptospiraceae bacterium]|nr:MAG: cobyrinic acid a,c-diamide synthase [Leptospiraceae bacterium]